MSLRAPGNGMRMALLVPAAACAAWLAVASTASARIAPPGRTLVGSARSDTLVGGAGDDRIRGRGGSDRLVGGAGDDLLLARDGQEDLVACGRGRDRAVVDRLDRVVGCEEVDAPLGARSRPVLIGNGLSIGGGWQLAVERVVPDATALLLEPRARYGVPTVYPSSGAWLLARVQLRYVGTAPMAGIDQIRLDTLATPLSPAPPPNSICLTPPLPLPLVVARGATVAGDVCFDVAPADDDTVQLRAQVPAVPTRGPTFFALQ